MASTVTERKLLLDGEWITTDEWIEVASPYDGSPVAPNQQFLVAVNNYRQSGGGGFPHIATAPVVYNAQVAIREAIVSYASAAGSIDPAVFHVVNWRLVRNGTPVF